MFNWTSSHMCGRWYLHMFLFRDGLLTLIYSFFDGSHEVLVLPPNYTEIIYGDIVTRSVIMVLYWGRGLQMFFEPLCRCSFWFSNIVFITLPSVTFVSIYDPTLFQDRIFILWSHKEVFDGKSLLWNGLVPHVNMAITSATIYWAKTSAKAHLVPYKHMAKPSAINIRKLHHSDHKITGHTNTHSPSIDGKLFRITFSSDQKKPCLKTGNSFLCSNKI